MAGYFGMQSTGFVMENWIIISIVTVSYTHLGFLLPGQIVHDSHYLDDPHLLKVYKIFIIFIK